jgi:WhiB family redox-sensing transcriptional regulator
LRSGYRPTLRNSGRLVGMKLGIAPGQNHGQNQLSRSTSPSPPPHHPVGTVSPVHEAVVRYLMAPDLNPPDVDLFQRPEWMARGACRDVPTDLFFLERGGNPRPGKALCAACVVRLDCLDYAMADPELLGIWGGTSERERDRLRRAAS